VDCCGLTKRWSLYVASSATPGSRRDLPAGRTQSLLTVSMRAVASSAVLANSALQAPLRATSSKSQPPHLVYGSCYYCLQNLSSDHLLSGVSAEYRKRVVASIGGFRSTTCITKIRLLWGRTVQHPTHPGRKCPAVVLPLDREAVCPGPFENFPACFLGVGCHDAIVYPKP
jgi:hypothetical protein